MIHPIALLIGWLLDLVFGDPERLPHPIVWFGRMIAFGEKRLNRGQHRKLKGGLMAVGLILLVFGTPWGRAVITRSLSFPTSAGSLALSSMSHTPRNTG